MRHWLRKLRHTLRMLYTLGMARMFGKYEYSGWDGEIDYCQYHWKGQSYKFPTGPKDIVS